MSLLREDGTGSDKTALVAAKCAAEGLDWRQILAEERRGRETAAQARETAARVSAIGTAIIKNATRCGYNVDLEAVRALAEKVEIEERDRESADFMRRVREGVSRLEAMRGLAESSDPATPFARPHLLVCLWAGLCRSFSTSPRILAVTRSRSGCS